MTNQYYVYQHVNLDGNIFYVGYGNKDRPKAKYGHDKIWRDIADKGYRVEIVSEHLTKKEAKDAENKLILSLTSIGCPLLNIASGGPKKAQPKSIETRAKISKALTGRTLSMETKAKMSETHKGKSPSQDTRDKLSSAFKGRTFSIESKAKMSKSNPGISPEKRAIMVSALRAYYDRKRLSALSTQV